MSYAELIEKLQTFPKAKQAEVFDFVEFLAARNQVEHNEEHSLAKSSLSDINGTNLSSKLRRQWHGYRMCNFRQRAGSATVPSPFKGRVGVGMGIMW